MRNSTRTTTMLLVTFAVLAIAVSPAFAGWIGSQGGAGWGTDWAREYERTTNWAGGTIDGDFYISHTDHLCISVPDGYATTADIDITQNASVSGYYIMVLNGRLEAGNTANMTLNHDLSVINNTGNVSSRLIVGNIGWFGPTCDLNINLGGGTRSFDTGNVNSTIWVNAVLANGGIVKTGDGVIEINKTNAYAGGTTVSGGLLRVNATGNLGAGDVLITAGGSVELNNTNSIADAATLSIDDMSGIYEMTLPAGLNETVDELYLDGVQVSPGTYGGLASTAANKYGQYFAGPGIITVLSGPAPYEGWIGSQGGAGWGTDWAREYERTTNWTNGVINGNFYVNHTDHLCISMPDGYATTADIDVTQDASVSGYYITVLNGRLAAGNTANMTLNHNLSVINTTGNVSSRLIVGNIGWFGATCDLNINLGGGTRTFDTANTDSTIWMNAALANGGIVKTGEGVMEINKINTYAGDTTVSGGLLKVNATGSLGTGNVTVNEDAKLDIYASDSIANTAVLNINQTASLINKIILEPGVNELVGELYINGVQMSTGTYGSTGSSAANKDDNYFGGTGVITVLNGPNPYEGWIGSQGGVGWPTPPNGEYERLTNWTNGVINGNFYVNHTNHLCVSVPDGYVTTTDIDFTQYTELAPPDNYYNIILSGRLEAGNTANMTLNHNVSVTNNTGSLYTKVAIGNLGYFGPTCDLNINLGGGTRTFDTTNTESNLWINGFISNGEVVKSGEGVMEINQPNTYAGGTTVNAGRLKINATGNLGTGNVIVEPGAMLELTHSSAIADTATLSFEGCDGVYGMVTLPFGVNESVNELYLDGTQMPPGTYGSTASAAQFTNLRYFAGPGILTVLNGPPLEAPEDLAYSDDIVVDGDVSDWDNADWVPSMLPYYPIPSVGLDISEAYVAFKWGAAGTKLYAAAKVRDNNHVLKNAYDAAVGDCLETYVWASSRTGNYNAGQYEFGQQYNFGLKTNGTDIWSGYAGPNAIPAQAGFTPAITTDGQWYYYEVAMTPFEHFGAMTDGTYTPKILAAEDVIGLDAAVDSNNGSTVNMLQAYDTGWKYLYTNEMKHWTLKRLGVSGVLTLSDYVGGAMLVPGSAEVRDASTGAVLETHAIVLDAAGKYTFATALRGQYVIAVKANHWISKKATITIPEDGNVTVNATLINGDCDGNNQITTADAAVVIAALDTKPGDAGWDPMADVDGDGETTSTDLSIVLKNIGAMGE